MTDTAEWITAVRSSHDNLAGLLGSLSPDQLSQQSYASEWSIADVASHLGSQAEIFGLFLDAGLTGSPAPGPDAFVPVWDRWNALPPAEQVRQSIEANETFVSRVEALSQADRDGFSLGAFGTELDLSGLLGMRLGEHALHSWDIAVALDPSAVIGTELAGPLLDRAAAMAGQVGVVEEGFGPVDIATTSPRRLFTLVTSPSVALTPDVSVGPDALELPAEALLRLIAGRLDPAHAPASVAADDRLVGLRRAFPGF